jgi:MFS family permease
MTTRDPYAAFRFRDYRLMIGGSLLANIGRAMVSVAIGWELYVRTNSAMALGWVGLIQALPIIVLAIPAGHVADRMDRKWIVCASRVIMALSSIGLMYLSISKGPVPLIYFCLLLGAIVQAFNGASASALLPQLVPRNVFHNALTWKSSSFQISSVFGPALGGLILAKGSAAHVYACDIVLNLFFAGCLAAMTIRKDRTAPREKTTLRSLVAGFHYVWKTKLILAAITLDLFAVLFGGATVLMPVFARDILHVGPDGLGWLRAAPAIGAFLMAITLAHSKPIPHVGNVMLGSVAGFGIVTIVFGLSKCFGLSLLMLVLLGAFDNISVVVRHNLVQLGTPDNMRGRVSAVNNVFISSSNELGDFESGLVASLFGATIAVVSGGIATIIVVVAAVFVWPELRRLKTLNGFETESTGGLASSNVTGP